MRPIRSLPSVMSCGGCSSTLWLGLLHPRLGFDEPLFEFADRGEIFVELLLIGGADSSRETSRFILHGVHDALPLAEFLHLLLHFGGGSAKEEIGEDV